MSEREGADGLPIGFYKDLLDHLDEAVYFVDSGRRILYWNRAAERLTGLRAEDVVGTHCCENVLGHVNASGEHLCRGECPVSATLRDGRSRAEDLFLRHREGHRVPVATRITPIRDGTGRIVGAAEVFRDNSDTLALVEQARHLQDAALLDALTGLPNRRCVETSLRSRFDEYDRYGWEFGVLFFDIDRFKEVNDRHGHETGDRVLRMVARTLASTTRTFDILGRWGGEEFLAVLANLDDLDLRSIAERSRMLVAESALPLDGDRLRVTVSVGGTMVQPGDSIESLLDRADRHMYRCKRTGRNRVSIHEPEADGVPG